MRKIILELTASLDGYIEGPNQEIDWIIFDEDAANYLNAFADEVDTVLYGRLSYELYGNYTGGENSLESEQEFFAKVNRMKKYVFSDSMHESDTSPALIRSKDMVETINRLRQEPGKHIWLFGGSNLITSFINLDLIDEYRISIQPVILGAGNPLFKNIIQRVPLKLIKTTAFSSGIVGLAYERG